MLQPGDEEWLREKHPGLTVAGEILSGSIQFRAGYDAKINQFFSIEEGATASTDAVILSGTLKIRIEPRADRSTSRLPALYVDGIEPAANRHFNSVDKSCLPLQSVGRGRVSAAGTAVPSLPGTARNSFSLRTSLFFVI